MPFYRSGLMSSMRAVLAVAALAAAAAPLQASAAGVSGQGNWETTLEGRDLDGNLANGYEAYYDTSLKLTWLADANSAGTTMTWDAAQTWASNLNVNGTTGWRLPTMVDTGNSGCDYAYSGTDCGFSANTSTSEMAHLFYVTLGNKATYDATASYQSDGGLTNTGPFSNVVPYGYWTGTAYAPSDNLAWFFNNAFGCQDFGDKGYGLFAWAVRSGDVTATFTATATAVPEPESYALALAGLAVAVLAARRRKR